MMLSYKNVQWSSTDPRGLNQRRNIISSQGEHMGIFQGIINAIWPISRLFEAQFVKQQNLDHFNGKLQILE